MEFTKTIRNPPEGIMNLHSFMDICLFVVETLCCQTDGQMLWSAAVNRTKSGVIEPTLYCCIDFFLPVSRNEGCRQLDGLKLAACSRSEHQVSFHTVMQNTPLHI